MTEKKKTSTKKSVTTKTLQADIKELKEQLLLKDALIKSFDDNKDDSQTKELASMQEVLDTTKEHILTLMSDQKVMEQTINEDQDTITRLMEQLQSYQEVHKEASLVNDLDPNEPCYHAMLLKQASEVEPLRVMSISKGIKNPENLTQVTDNVLASNFGMDINTINDVYLTCEDYACVYLYKLSDIKHLNLTYDGKQVSSRGTLSYKGS